MRLLTISVLLLLVMSLCSCAKDRAAAVPIYVDIPSIAFTPHQSGSTHGISEVWAYADSIFIGAYNVPVRFPIIGLEQPSLELFAGVRQNASGSDLVIYPFYDRHRVPSAITSDLTTQPRFGYLPAVVFPFIETFAGEHRLSVDLDQDPATRFDQADLEGIEETYGEATLTMGHPILEIATSRQFALPTDGRPVYLEFDYQGQMDWQIGIGVNGSSNDLDRRYLLQLLPQQSWQKVYLELTPGLQGINAGQISILIRGQYDNARSEIENQSLRIDNLKVVHFGP